MTFATDASHTPPASRQPNGQAELPSTDLSSTDLSSTEAAQPVLDARIARLQQAKHTWAQLPLDEKIHHLARIRDNTARLAQRWVQASVQAKRIPPGSPAEGEEWLAGPWAVIWAAQNYLRTLTALRDGTDLLALTGGVRTGINGQVVVDVFPLDIFDRLIVSGVRAEVWMQPDVTLDNLRASMARFYRQPAPAGRVALVLGAGNIASIAPNDVLHKLIAEGKVCLLKMNPVNAYLGPILEEIFASLRAYGFIEFAYGGVEVGQYLTDHPQVEEIHITGSARTHDAIVFGSGAEGQQRKAENRPRLHKPITSELGNVTPTVVLPGPWTDEDLRFQAEHIATQKMNNASFNCVAAQVLVMPDGWPLRERLLYHLRAVLRQTPPRYPYYPGAAERVQRVVAAYPQAELIDGSTGGSTSGGSTSDGSTSGGSTAVPRTLVLGLTPASAGDLLLQEEAFAPVLAEVLLPGQDPVAYLRQAVEFCNERLWGTLGANLIAHPYTLRALRRPVQQALADLRYGTIGVNIWAAAGFNLSQTSWGAAPGHTLADVGSGIGTVHNTFLFEQPQKSVIYGNFTPFPRNFVWENLARREFHNLPTPPWHLGNRQAPAITRIMTRLAAQPGWLPLPGLFLRALRG